MGGSEWQWTICEFDRGSSRCPKIFIFPQMLQIESETYIGELQFKHQRILSVFRFWSNFINRSYARNYYLWFRGFCPCHSRSRPPFSPSFFFLFSFPLQTSRVAVPGLTRDARHSFFALMRVRELSLSHELSTSLFSGLLIKE